MNTSPLLIQEPPLQVLPSLAKALGLNEALFLQQLHYWLLRSTHEHEGRKWVYNTPAQWRVQFPFWSESTIERIVAALKGKAIILIGHFAESPHDRTNWYTINYDKLPDAGNAQRQVDVLENVSLTACSLSETTQEITIEEDIPQERPSLEVPREFLPLISLPGYKHCNHERAFGNIRAACAEAQVPLEEVIRLFATEYPVLRHQYGWSDPVATLKGKPLLIAISKVLNSQNGGNQYDVPRRGFTLHQGSAGSKENLSKGATRLPDGRIVYTPRPRD